LRSLYRIVVEIIKAVRHEMLSTAGTLFTVFLAMTLPGTLWVISDNLGVAEYELKSGLTMDVFLISEPSEQALTEMQTNLEDLPGITDVKFVSSSDALFRMRETFGLEAIKGLEDNPLPPSFVLSVDESLYDQSAADSVMDRIRAIPDVEDVVYAGDILRRLQHIIRSVKILGLAVAILVAFSAIFIVANTVRVAVADRRKAVEIMQLVGATRNYILAPFVSLGGLIGILGGALAIAFLWLAARFISAHLLEVIFLDLFDSVAFIMVGLLLGMIGAVVATRKHLKI